MHCTSSSSSSPFSTSFWIGAGGAEVSSTSSSSMGVPSTCGANCLASSLAVLWALASAGSALRLPRALALATSLAAGLALLTGASGARGDAGGVHRSMQPPVGAAEEPAPAEARTGLPGGVIRSTKTAGADM